VTIEEAMVAIQLPMQMLTDLRTLPYPDACEGLGKFKEAVRRRRRDLAKKHHPDVGGDAAVMQDINSICDALLSIKIQRMPQPVMRVYYYGRATSTASSTYYGA